MHITISKKNLMELGYGPSFSASIIKQSKNLMVSKGYTFYSSRKLDRVPCEAVEEILGIKFKNPSVDTALISYD